MRDCTQGAVAYALREHARTGHLTDPERLAHALGVRVVPGARNAASHGPPSVITLRRDQYAPRQRFTMHHELAHILIQRAGLQDGIRSEVDDDEAAAHLEAVTNHIASLLVMPDPMIRVALDTFGLTPETVLLVRDAGRVSLAAAMRRVIHAQEQSATAWVSAGPYVLDVTSSDPYNRLTRYQRLPDARAALPDAALLALPGEARLLGVVGW
ncbi:MULTISPECIES: ImmA/IrrE family metallo-endopeptidase [Deinococcus]|uniref:ImmA/IrrE family metallo-endopeptidase n=1 Tax=Deinococcus rufus TaxID=2136097 RepID=A0ABV7ZCI0_9DEIO|nr:ImmA/IrrE family metallo-endopeptidase [Deinococcus sp. AB2017081]WQE94080.1 ImmA/IrrE family metallo-endopeptidase [Deinococcus sp. AB2017081]